MTPVPSYQVQQFLNWLQEHQVQIDDIASLQHEQLLYWAKQFLSEQWDRNFFKEDKDNLLIFILQIFQNCPMIKETSVIRQMKHFTQCGRCLNHLEIPKTYKIHSLYSLHPLLEDFLYFFNKKPLSREIDNFFADRKSQSKILQFHVFIKKFGSQIFEEFSQYIKSVDRQLIEDYISSDRNNYSFRDDDIRGIEERTKLLDLNETLEQAANRLVITTIERDQKPKLIDIKLIDIKINVESVTTLNKVKNYPEFLEFMEWLKKNYRNNPINQATSPKKIKEIVTQFCQELNYDNAQQFSKEVINWLLPTFIHKVVNLLLIEIYPQPEKSMINLGLSKFIERYETIHFHGIFLFGKNNNFSAFVKHHRRDLHHLTDEYMDIYYSKYDIEKHNATAYQRRKQFRNLDVVISHIPAFIIWKDSLTNSQIISLEGLSHQQIFDVVKHITSGIEQKKSLDEVSKIGRDKVESYLNHVAVVNYYNVGQAAAVGSNAIACDTVFNQLFDKTDNQEGLP